MLEDFEDVGIRAAEELPPVIRRSRRIRHRGGGGGDRSSGDERSKRSQKALSLSNLDRRFRCCQHPEPKGLSAFSPIKLVSDRNKQEKRKPRKKIGFFFFFLFTDKTRQKNSLDIQIPNDRPQRNQNFHPRNRLPSPFRHPKTPNLPISLIP